MHASNRRANSPRREGVAKLLKEIIDTIIILIAIIRNHGAMPYHGS